MAALFFYGSLRDASLMRVVLGTNDAVMQDATLPGFGIFWADGQMFPTIEAQPGAVANGVLLAGLNPDQVARLDFYEGGFGYDLREVEVEVDGAPHGALVYFPRPGQWVRGAPFDLAVWQAKWGPISRLAAIEAMGYLGRFSGSELAWRMPMIRARAASQLAATGVPANVRTAQGRDTVQEISNEASHAGFFVTQVLDLRHPTFDGATSDTLRREVFVATDAALVLPYDPVRDRVLLVEQFRMGPYGRGDPRPWMLEPVAGRVDPGETPEQTAHRECMEEAGISLIGLEKIAGYYCTPGYSTEYFHNFVGLTDLPDDLPRLGGLDTEAEDIRLHLLSFDDAIALIGTGEADNGPLILSLMWLSQNRERLRAAP